MLVAVCTERGGHALERSVAAVAAQSARVALLIAGDAPSPAPLPAGVEVVHTAPGMAQARNAALAACDAEVLALVDGDVVVADGWLEALAAAWARAGDDVAAIGGPLAAEVDGGRFPAELAAHLPTLDLGDEELDIDPRERTLLGGNLSFRADALRGIGGMWPMRGRPGVRDWFSAEHHAQRELRAAGWRIRYAPAARATRIIERRRLALVRGRWAYGARRAVQGGPGAAPAPARHAASALLGAGGALARGDTARSGARALRAVENAGALLGPWVAHDDFQPLGPTPFRASVPSAQPGPGARLAARARARVRRREPAAAILLYHRVADVERDGLGLVVRPEHFAEHVQVLRDRWRPVSLTEMARTLRAGEVPERAVAVTLDDGYVDNLVNAAPALGEVPATAFVATGVVARDCGFFWDEAQRLVEAASPAGRLDITLGGERRAWRVATPDQRRVALRHVHQWLQAQRPEGVARALAELRAGRDELAAPAGDRALTVEELRELSVSVDIGAHTRHHPRLAALARAEQRAEIEGSRDDVARWLNRAPTGFAYPFGVPGFDFTAETVELVRAAGFDHAVANAAAPVTAASDPLALPRLVAPDVGGEAFAAWLEGQVVG